MNEDEFQRKIDELRDEIKLRLDELEDSIQVAFDDNDGSRLKELQEDREALQRMVDKLS